MHLLRLLKHPFNHNIKQQQTIINLLNELGATQSEINRARPATSELNEALRRKLAQQQSASQAAAAQRRPLEPSPSMPETKRMRVSVTLQSQNLMRVLLYVTHYLLYLFT